MVGASYASLEKKQMMLRSWYEEDSTCSVNGLRPARPLGARALKSAH